MASHSHLVHSISLTHSPTRSQLKSHISIAAIASYPPFYPSTHSQSPSAYFFTTYSSHPPPSSLSTLAITSFSISSTYFSSAALTPRPSSLSSTDRIRSASNAALVELLIATVATGTPRYHINHHISAPFNFPRKGKRDIPASAQYYASYPHHPACSPSRAHPPQAASTSPPPSRADARPRPRPQSQP